MPKPREAAKEVQAENEVSSQADILARNRKILELPSGIKIQIRKLAPIDFADFGEVPIAGGLIPGADTGQDEPIKTILPPEIMKARVKQGRDWVEQTAIRGVTRPKLVAEKDEGLHPSDFGDELNLIVEEILRFSGLLDEDNNPFRPGESDGAPGGRSSETVREVSA